MSEKSYDLKKSVEGLGQLYPILIDAHGNIIDGFHRKEIDPKWPTVKLEHIDSTVKLEAARLAANFNRRDVPPEELTQKIGFLIGAGLKVEEVAEQTGISERTIYKYMPERLKDKKMVEAGGKAYEEYRKSQDKAEAIQLTVKTQDMPLVECDCCRMGTRNPKPFGKYKQLCENCYVKAVKYPRLFQREPAITKPKEYKPKESWEQRRALMHPQHSKMEQELLLKLQGSGAMTDKLFCLQSTTPDFYFPKQKLAIYVDGPVHKGKEERDSRLRDLLTKRHEVRVVSIPYESFTKQEVERVFKQIKEALT